MTAKQRQLLDYIEGFIKEHRYSPSIQEMGDAMGGKAVGTIHAHLQTLMEMGYIEKEGRKRGYIVKSK